MPDDRLKHRNLELEARLLEEGRQAIREGRCIGDDAVDEWLEGLDGDQELEIHPLTSIVPERRS